jgi:hypothetical protein
MSDRETKKSTAPPAGSHQSQPEDDAGLAIGGRSVEPRRGFSAWIRLGLDAMAERRFARRRGRELLQFYERIHGSQPQASGEVLYAKVVILAGYNPKEAQSVILRATQSFCEWPTERQLRFRDVVRYLVVTEYLRSHAGSDGTHTNMENAAMRVIPEKL